MSEVLRALFQNLHSLPFLLLSPSLVQFSRHNMHWTLDIRIYLTPVHEPLCDQMRVAGKQSDRDRKICRTATPSLTHSLTSPDIFVVLWRFAFIRCVKKLPQGLQAKISPSTPPGFKTGSISGGFNFFKRFAKQTAASHMGFPFSKVFSSLF